MALTDLIYNLVLYRYPMKKAAIKLLQQRWVYQNPLYSYIYSSLTRGKMRKYYKTPFRVMIENTNSCNADCVFCPHRMMKRKVGVMNMDLYRKIIDQCKKCKVGFVTVYGFGEPLLDKDFFKRILYAKRAGIRRVTTNTNAMYLNKSKIKQVFNCGLDEIYISFDAATANTYKKIRPGLDFATVEKNINQLVEEKNNRGLQKPFIVLSYVESKENKHETKKYIKKWRDKVDYISVSSIHNWTGAVNNRDEGMRGRRDPCRLLWTDMVISWDGRVPLCCNDYENKTILGNITKKDIPQIWGGKKLQQIRKNHKNSQFDKVKLCAKCTYNYHHKSPWWVGK